MQSKKLTSAFGRSASVFGEGLELGGELGTVQ